MTHPESGPVHCETCGAIFLQLRDAWRKDYEKMRVRAIENWKASGLGLNEYYKAYLPSELDRLEAEGGSLQASGFPTVAEVRQKATEHELRTGHSISLNGWRSSGFNGDLGSWFR